MTNGAHPVKEVPAESNESTQDSEKQEEDNKA